MTAQSPPDQQSLSAHIVAHYERHAANWAADRAAAAWNDRGWHQRFVAALAPGSTVLDLGCGSGSPIARHLVANGLRVTGVDTSPTLISYCRREMPDQDWIVADMRTLALGRRFAGLLAWDSFFHLAPDDQRLMFRVFRAHAAPGAILMFNTGPAFGEAIGNYRGDPLYHASLDCAEYRQWLTAIGFEVVDHVIEDPSAGGRTVWMARRAG